MTTHTFPLRGKTGHEATNKSINSEMGGLDGGLIVWFIHVMYYIIIRNVHFVGQYQIYFFLEQNWKLEITL